MKGLYKCALMLLMAVFIILAAACQPTPDTAPIVGKGDNHLEEMIASSAASPSPAASSSLNAADPGAALRAAVGAPETFADSYTNEKGDVTVTIDANVEVPPVDALPAVQASISDFTQEQVDKLGEYFLKGAALYSEEQTRTKAEIEESIINEQQYLQELKDEFTGIRDEDIKESEKYLEGLKKQYEEAPVERKRTPATLQLQNGENGTELFVLADLGKDAEARFSVSNSVEYGSNLGFTNAGKGSYDPYSDMQGKQKEAPKGMKTTREEAEGIVTKCLSDLGITDMCIDSVKVATYYMEENNEGHEVPDKQCYAFSLARVIGGVPMLHIEGSTELGTDDPNVPVPEEPDYNLVREPEGLLILVDDTGIVYFSWTNPTEVGTVLSEHVTFLPFSDVVSRAKDNMFYKNYTAYGSKADIKITSIKLNMLRIMRKDKPGEFLIVPVWDFIGNHKEDIGGREDWLPFGDQSYVTINAIDGSMIHRDWGY